MQRASPLASSRPATPAAGRQSPAVSGAAAARSTPAPTPSNVPVLYRGSGGKAIDVSANYVRLDTDKESGFGIFQYEVIFQPPMDSREERFRIIRLCSDVLGDTKLFDGHKLYLPKLMDETFSVDKGGLKITFRYHTQISHGQRESLYIYNLCFNKIMKDLKFAQSSKKGSFFDPKAAKDIKVRFCNILGHITRNFIL